MKARLPLFGKILFLAFLNLCLLGLALALIARAQFRVDSGSFLLGPAQGRIMGAADNISLELNETEPEGWNRILERYGRSYGASFMLFDETGEKLAGAAVPLPREVADRVPQRQQGAPRRRQGDAPRGPGDPPQDRPAERKREDGQRAPAPPLFLTATSHPTAYWAGVRIPVRRERDRDPHPGTLLIHASSLMASPLLFDARPWVMAGAAVIAISVLCWLPFIRGITRSISHMTRAAGQVAEGQFDIQVPAGRRDEIGQLGQAINRMSERLSAFVNGQKAFLAGIAHELCTPIATIQFGLGNLERRVAEDQREAVADIQEDVHHMAALVNELLSFSKAGMRALDVKPVKVNLAATVAQVLEREGSPEVRISVSVSPDLNAMADPEYVFRALSNVIRNAIRYAGHAGPIQISAQEQEDHVLLTVADSGPGVPENSLEEIFAPFHRVDPSRSQQTGGVGLGLAIVRTCVEACGGAVRCRNRQPSGLEVEIRLPQAKL